MAEGCPTTGLGGVMPHSNQHPTQYSPVTQPANVASGTAQYLGVAQPFFFSPGLNTFLPGPHPPRHHAFLVPGGGPPPPGAPPQAALQLCHTHHVGQRGGATVPPVNAGGAPSPPPTAPTTIPAAPTDTSSAGLLLSSLGVAPSFGSVVPTTSYEQRLASAAAVPAPPAGAAGAVAPASRRSPSRAASLPYAAQQQTLRVGRKPATGARRFPTVFGEAPRLPDVRTAQSTESGFSASSCRTAAATGGISPALAFAQPAVMGDPCNGRDVSGSSLQAAETRLRHGGVSAHAGPDASVLSGGPVSRVDASVGNKLGEVTDVRSAPQPESSRNFKNLAGCGSSVRHGSSSVSSKQPCLKQQQCPSHRSGETEDRQPLHHHGAHRRPDLATRSREGENMRGELEGRPFEDVFSRPDAVQTRIPHQHQQPEDVLEVGRVRTVGDEGGSCRDESAKLRSSDMQDNEKTRVDMGGGSVPGRRRSREEDINATSFKLLANVMLGGSDAPPYPRGEGGVVGREVGDCRRESNGEIAGRSCAVAASAAPPPLTQHNKGMWDPAVASMSDDWGRGGREDHSEMGTRISLDGIGDSRKGGHSAAEGKTSFMSAIGGGSSGGGPSRNGRCTQESGRSRLVTAGDCSEQFVQALRKQLHQVGPSEQQHTSSHEQPSHTVAHRDTCSLGGGGRGGGRSHAHGGRSVAGGPRDSVGYNNRYPSGGGGSRPGPSADYSLRPSRRSLNICSYSGAGERGKRDTSRLGGRRRRRSSSGGRRVSGDHDSPSRDSSPERRRRRSSPSIQRPVVGNDTRSSRSGSVASLPSLEQEGDGLEKQVGGAVSLFSGADADAVSDDADDGEMDLERSNSNSLERRSPSLHAMRADDRSSVSLSPGSEVFTNIQGEACSYFATGGMEDSTSIGLLAHKERKNGRRRPDEGGGDKLESQTRLRPRRNSTRSTSGGDGGYRKSNASRKDTTAENGRPVHSSHQHSRPSSPRGHHTTPTEPGAPFTGAAFPRSSGSSTGRWMDSKRGGGGGADPRDAQGSASHTRDSGTRSGGSAGSPLKPGTATGVSSSDTREATSFAVRGPLFDLWVPTTFHPLCPERVRLVLGPKGRTHKEMEQFTKTRVQLYGRELVRDTSKHEYDPFRDNQPLHLVVGDKVRRGEWTEATIKQMKEKLEAFLEQLVQRTWPRTEQRQPIPFYDKQLHIGPSAGPLVYVDPLGKWNEFPPRDLLPCLVYDPTRGPGGIISSPQQQHAAAARTTPGIVESDNAATGEGDACSRASHEEETGVKYEGDSSLLLNCTPPLCLLLLTLQAAHGLLVEEGAQELVTLPLVFEKKWDVRFLFRREDFQAAGLPSFTAERKQVSGAAIDSLIYTPEGHMHEEAVAILTRFVKEFPEVFDLIEEATPPVCDPSVLSPPRHCTLKVKARDHPDFASVAQRFKRTDPWLQGGQPHA